MNEIQIKLLDMMRDIEKIVQKTKLVYSISDGTALGAIRHKGFIPWDDDVDYEVPSFDYRKFIDELKENLPKNYIVMDEKVGFNDESYTKIINTDVKIEHDYWEYNDERISQYLWVDIFELILTNKKNEVKKVKKWATLNYLRNFIIRNKFLNITKKILKLIPAKLTQHMIQRHKTKSSASGKYKYWYRLFLGQDKKPGELVWELKTKKIEFEGVSTRIWENHDIYLTTKYGDYNTIPKVGDRETHGFWLKK